ncbi:hypothetical protein ElyMa_002195000 [Elysia marginata]|uniref:Uncharacterized protein n=1 Tax=Elysia marginata TaxID=1093978 RepID=A0AAV4FR69_9GAST|nr:hypothetical protein ElyMa_002195000 [Elysia marginata]
MLLQLTVSDRKLSLQLYHSECQVDLSPSRVTHTWHSVSVSLCARLSAPSPGGVQHPAIPPAPTDDDTDDGL